MNSQNNFYRPSYMDDSDKGSWQQPSSVFDGVYSGAPQSYLNQTQPNRSGSSTGTKSFNQAYSGDGNTDAIRNNSYMDSQFNKPYQDASSSGYYYGGYPYDYEGSFTPSSQKTGQATTSFSEMSKFSNYNSYDNIGMTGSTSDMNFGGPTYHGQDSNMMMPMSDNSDNGFGMNGRGKFGEDNSYRSYQIDGGPDKTSEYYVSSGKSSSGDWNKYDIGIKQNRGNYGDSGSCNYPAASSNRGWRGRGRVHRGNFRNAPYFNRRLEQPHQSNAALTITLNATNHNQWGYLRKNFHKQDDELAEHLFEIHEKFCHRCQQRNEERKALKKKKGDDQEKETAGDEGETPEEDMSEEELQMKQLMGFSGFKSTKSSKAKGSAPYELISSLNQSNDGSEENTALTEDERKMISSIGGYSVFAKNSQSQSQEPVFGAPAITMEPTQTSKPIR